MKNGMKLADWIPIANHISGPFGWVSPNKMVFITDSMKHIEFLKDVPELAEAYSKYESEVESNAEWMDNELSYAAENDEHPEMHRFDGMDDDARDHLYKAAYDAGWVRFGTMVDSDDWRGRFETKKNARITLLEIYGSPEGIGRVIGHCRLLAKEMNLYLRSYRVKVGKKRGYYNPVFEYDCEEADFRK